MEAARTIDAIWRNESARVIAGLTRIVRDVGVAEELAQDALVTALETWPASGIPENPGAWLMTTAKNRALDRLRKQKLAERKHEELAHVTPQTSPSEAIEDAVDDDIGDDLLRLVFISCHPILSTEARVALTLRLLGGLTTDEIAHAFLLPEPTIAQRIVRAKRTLSEAKVPFEVPRGDALFERLASVLGVIYLVFNEGYSATAGADWMRPTLCDDALRLARILTELMPEEPEVHGIVALMEIQHSRARARVNDKGEPILLLDQDRARWDHAAIARGLEALAQAEARGGRGTYVLQAEIAACHGRAKVAAATDWKRIAAIYAEIVGQNPSPVVELNRAVAVSMAEGPEAGLAIVDAIAGDPALASYYLLPGVRGDLLYKAGRFAEAKVELERAAALTRNARERETFLARAADCEKS